MPRRPEIEVIARALIIQQGHILLCRNRARGTRFLPGGHVELGEPAAAALARELREEAGLRARVGDLAFTAEHAFRRRSALSHEVLLVFHVELPRARTGGLVPVESREAKIAFDWVPMTGLARAKVLPAGLVAAIRGHGRARGGGLLTVQPWAG